MDAMNQAHAADGSGSAAPGGVDNNDISRLERMLGGLPARALLERVLVDRLVGEVALVSSFGADSAVMLHLVASIDPATPVIFVDTGKLFEETLAYRDRMVAMLGLSDVRTVRPTLASLACGDPAGERHTYDPDGCCHLRKVVPLSGALSPFDAWLNGRRRDQTGDRASIRRFEVDEAGRMKINPLADWHPKDVARYLRENGLPLHPLVLRGYKSLGCAPCTTPVAEDEDPRAGRWRGRDKTECGIHLVNGRLVRRG